LSRPNAIGRIVAGAANPNWKGGLLAKVCEVCGVNYSVKRAHANSRFCSRQCVGVSQRGQGRARLAPAALTCAECGANFTVPPSHAHRHRCCSIPCRDKQHAKRSAGEANANWRGGLSRLPYPWNFREISAAIIERDGFACRAPDCRGADKRMTAHHINYDKSDCRPINLIALCSACNSRANFGRDQWQAVYEAIMAARTDEVAA
jgi:hypothetical protein